MRDAVVVMVYVYFAVIKKKKKKEHCLGADALCGKVVRELTSDISHTQHSITPLND